MNPVAPGVVAPIMFNPRGVSTPAAGAVRWVYFLSQARLPDELPLTRLDLFLSGKSTTLSGKLTTLSGEPTTLSGKPTTPSIGL